MPVGYLSTDHKKTICSDLLPSGSAATTTSDQESGAEKDEDYNPPSGAEDSDDSSTEKPVRNTSSKDKRSGSAKGHKEDLDDSGSTKKSIKKKQRVVEMGGDSAKSGEKRKQPLTSEDDSDSEKEDSFKKPSLDLYPLARKVIYAILGKPSDLEKYPCEAKWSKCIFISQFDMYQNNTFNIFMSCSAEKAVYVKKKVPWDKWLLIKHDLVTLLIKEFHRQGLTNTTKNHYPSRRHVSNAGYLKVPDLDNT